MANVKIVTGYTPIPDHPRTPAEYGALGEKLGAVPVPKQRFMTPLQNCWMTRFLWENGPVKWAEGDNPKKATLAYHIVQYQKTEWLLAAAMMEAMQEAPKVDTFVWVDYAIFHQPGITSEKIVDFIKKVGEKKLKQIVIPGCWPKGPVEDNVVCWRFCGSILVVPKELLQPFHNAVKTEVQKHVWRHKFVTHEVNTWARVEQAGRLPIRWYPANHDSSMLDNYPGD